MSFGWRLTSLQSKATYKVLSHEVESRNAVDQSKNKLSTIMCFHSKLSAN
jgi:hypothetical protein